MGFVKINFHNAHSVYPHDTPSKSLFRRNLRTYSSGCVRVQSVKQLVAWLLQPNGWDIPAVAQINQTGERKDLTLTRNRSDIHSLRHGLDDQGWPGEFPARRVQPGPS